MSDPWFRLRSGPTDPALNMAIDQALLESAPDRGVPVLRCYSWDRPAASFGYFQRLADVSLLTPLRPLVRRSTGGGVVPHDADWTYSVVIPPEHPWYDVSATESYERMHRWLRDAFERIGVPTRLAPCCDPSGPGQCFVGAEKSDLLHGDRKIAGAAQRRNRLGLLIQGSIHPPTGADRPAFESALEQVATLQHAAAWDDLPDIDRLLEQARRINADIYAAEAHTARR
jgi:lipoate-protein ligase A